MKKKPLIILTGPTAVGKTKLSISLAKAIDGEIISADSMQVYQDMNIGSAKISTEEMDGVEHHLIDIRTPLESYDVVQFQNDAKACMEKIWERKHIPILVGGTGFYIQAVLKDIDFTEANSDNALRKELEEYAQKFGAEKLHEQLLEIDPVSAQKIEPQNVKRTIRAIEYYRLTGEMISLHNEQEQLKESPYNYAYFVLHQDRDILYERINLRIDQMLENGLLEEVKELQKKYHVKRGMVSMQGLGYKELLDYLDGICSYDEAIEILKRDTRHFAKRQLTWFRREKDVIWIEKKTDEENLNEILFHCKEKNLI